MLPTIRRYAEKAFRRRDAEAQEDAVAEIIAGAFVAYVRLLERGKVESAYPTVLVRYAIKHFFSGRRIGNRFNARDALSSTAQRRHGFVVESLDRALPADCRWLDAVVEDTATPVADQAAFRCDFPAWLRKQKPRHRRIAEALSQSHTTVDVARRFQVTPSRISQLRRELCDSWLAFCDEDCRES